MRFDPDRKQAYLGAVAAVADMRTATLASRDWQCLRFNISDDSVGATTIAISRPDSHSGPSADWSSDGSRLELAASQSDAGALAGLLRDQLMPNTRPGSDTDARVVKYARKLKLVFSLLHQDSAAEHAGGAVVWPFDQAFKRASVPFEPADPRRASPAALDVVARRARLQRRDAGAAVRAALNRAAAARRRILRRVGQL